MVCGASLPCAAPLSHSILRTVVEVTFSDRSGKGSDQSETAAIQILLCLYRHLSEQLVSVGEPELSWTPSAARSRGYSGQVRGRDLLCAKSDRSNSQAAQ